MRFVLVVVVASCGTSPQRSTAPAPAPEAEPVVERVDHDELVWWDRFYLPIDYDDRYALRREGPVIWLGERIVGINLAWPEAPTDWLDHVSDGVSIALRSDQVCELSRERLPSVVAIRLYREGEGDVVECLKQLAPQALILEGSSTDDSFLRELESIPLRELYLFETGVSRQGLMRLSHFTELRVLSLIGATIDDEVLGAIARLRSLESLDLSVTGLTNEGLRRLAPLNHLRILHVGSTQVTNLAGLEAFPRLQILGLRLLHNLEAGSLEALRHTPRLQRLDVTNAAVNNEDTMHIARLIELVELNMNGTYIDDQGVVQLCAAPSIRDLDLSRTAITNTAVEYLKRLAHLRNLALMSTEIDDDAAPSLCELAGLRYLEVRGTEMTDAGLSQLEVLPLRHLDMRFTQASPELVESFAARGINVCAELTTSTYPICG